MSPDVLKTLVLVLVALLLSNAVHEFAHAAMARALGDDTAERQGRFTLDPTKHIDPFGSLILPTILVLMQTGFFFGWAKPVPFSPNNLTRKLRVKHGVLLIAAAGPAANLVLAGICAILFRIIEPTSGAVFDLLHTMVLLNVVLALFNLLPVPPLDGSKVLVGLLPDSALKHFRFLDSNPWIVPLAFVLVFLVAGRLLGGPVMSLTIWMLGG